MIKALLYLQGVSLRNATLGKLRRLKSPRYLLASIFGAAYMYYFVVRNTTRGFSQMHNKGLGDALNLSPEQWSALFASLAAPSLLLVMALSWIFNPGKAALKFSETEIAVLFPAPLPRRLLINFKLVTALTGLLFASLLFALMSGPLIPMASFPLRAMGLWLVLSGIHLHNTGAAFTCERLAQIHLPTWLRRTLISVVLAAGLFALIYWLSKGLDESRDAAPIALASLLSTSILGKLLLPLRLLVQPLSCTDATSFWIACLPALGVLALLYLWVLYGHTSFEEASIAAAEKRTRLITAAKAGKFSKAPGKQRSQPFKLDKPGSVEMAFLWRGLIATGAWSHPRNFGSIVLGLCSLVVIASKFETGLIMIQIMGPMLLPIGFSALFAAALLLRKSAPQLISRMETMKTLPLPGWKIVVGEMVSPVFLLTASLLGLILVFLVCLHFAGSTGPLHDFATHISTMWLFATALLAPFLFGFITSIHFAAALFFPAWSSNMNSQTADIGLIGQRIFFMLAFLLMIVVTALPALAVGAIPFLLIKLALHANNAAIFYGTITTAVAMGAELAVIIHWLGERYERIDVSQDLAR